LIPKLFIGKLSLAKKDNKVRPSNLDPRLKDSDITWLYGPFLPASSAKDSHHASIRTRDTKGTSPTKSLLKQRNPAKTLQQRSEYTFSLLREATGFRLPSPTPSPVLEPQAQFSTFGNNALGIELKANTSKKVVFNEIVILYREVVDESEGMSDSEDSVREDYFRDFDDKFEGDD